VYVSALSPFIDPGSLAFTIRSGTDIGCAPHAGGAPCADAGAEWWDTLNYESEAMTRYELAQAAIEAETRVTQARASAGLCPGKMAKHDLALLGQEQARLENSEQARATRSRAPA